MWICPKCNHPHVNHAENYPFPNPVYLLPRWKSHCLSCDKYLATDSHVWTDGDDFSLCCNCYVRFQTASELQIKGLSNKKSIIMDGLKK
jgi:hypothetical protein